MSSDISSITKEITTNGFWAHEDADIGDIVDRIVNNKYQIYTDDGLRLWKAAVFQNESISSIIKTLIPEPSWMLCRAFGRTRLTHCLLRTEQIQLLTVLCWSPGSEVTLHPGSHTCQLATAPAKNGLLYVSDEALQNITPQTIKMDKGGLMIVDARCCWQILKGKCFFLGFATPEETRFWFPMSFPLSMQDAVTSITKGTGISLRANFFTPKRTN